MFQAITSIGLPKVLMIIVPVLTTLFLTAWIVTGQASNSSGHPPCSADNAAQESCRVRDVEDFNIIYAHTPSAYDHMAESRFYELYNLRTLWGNLVTIL